jgi:anti-sigma factor RsiW
MSPRFPIPWRRRAPSPGLSCRELVELVTDYWEGALDAADRARFEDHVHRCGHCDAYLEQLRLTVDVAHALEPEALDPHVERELLAAFRTWKTEEAP